ncbi:hypothetical protein ECG_09223 [Echinococcus granulosus]|nr:hypothetical protein ECG_09223 [Echinococcus granulosus]
MEQPPPPHTALPISEASKQGETQPSCTQTFGVDSRVAYCPTCRLKVNTIVDNQISTAKFLCLFVLCLITAPLFLFLIPFVSSGYQEIVLNFIFLACGSLKVPGEQLFLR